jgi:hypothetical protein
LADDIRHFTDTLIFARMEAKKEEGMQSPCALDEDHLIQTLAEIYFGEFGLHNFFSFKHLNL